MPTSRTWYFFSTTLAVAGATFVAFDLQLIGQPKTTGVNAAQNESPAAPDAPIEKPHFYKLSDIGTWNIMGQPIRSFSGINVDSLPETALDIKLLGTFTSNKDRSSAVILVENNRSKRLFSEDEVTDGVTLHTVREHEVIINRGSVLEVLKLYEPVEHSRPHGSRQLSISPPERYPLNPERPSNTIGNRQFLSENALSGPAPGSHADGNG